MRYPTLSDLSISLSEVVIINMDMINRNRHPSILFLVSSLHASSYRQKGIAFLLECECLFLRHLHRPQWVPKPGAGSNLLEDCLSKAQGTSQISAFLFPIPECLQNKVFIFMGLYPPDTIK